MTKKELEPLLLDANQVRQLTGLTVETLQQVRNFPKPVKLEHQRYHSDIYRNRWKRKDVENWINKLEEKF